MSRVRKEVRRRGAKLARAVGKPLGRATAGVRMLPDFLIVGAQRAGTTSLYNYLAQHPDVGRVRLGKGVHYFDTNFDRSIGWYRSHFPIDKGKVPFVGRTTHVGEGAPYYMFHPLAAERIEQTLPDVKLIAVLRDPVERAHSQWAHESARGFENLDFRAALEAEPSRLEGEEDRMRRDPTAYSFSHQHHSYVARGMYADQLERLWSRFGRERVLVLSSAQLFSDPETAFANALGFLDLPPFEATFEVHNARQYAALDAEVACWLRDRFEEPNAHLAELLGPEFDFRPR